jgi:hypothetical protein
MRPNWLSNSLPKSNCVQIGFYFYLFFNFLKKKTLDEFGFFLFPQKKLAKITQFKLGRNKKSFWNSSRPMHALVKGRWHQRCKKLGEHHMTYYY